MSKSDRVGLLVGLVVFVSLGSAGYIDIVERSREAEAKAERDRASQARWEEEVRRREQKDLEDQKAIQDMMSRPLEPRPVGSPR